MARRHLWSLGFLALTMASLRLQAKEASTEMPERFAFGFNAGLTLPSTIGGTSYSAFPTVGLNFEYKPIPYFGIGASTQNSLFLASGQSSVYQIESAVLPQVMVYAGNLGLYAGLRGGLNVTMFNTGNLSSSTIGFVWGPKVGYQYHFPGARIAFGPELNMLFVSSSSVTTTTYSTSTTVTLPSHTITNLVVVLKWWF